MSRRFRYPTRQRTMVATVEPSEEEGTETERVQNNNSNHSNHDDNDSDENNENDENNHDQIHHDRQDSTTFSDDEMVVHPLPPPAATTTTSSSSTGNCNHHHHNNNNNNNHSTTPRQRRSVASETSNSDMSQQSTSMRMESVKSRIRLQREQSLSLLQAVGGTGGGCGTGGSTGIRSHHNNRNMMAISGGVVNTAPSTHTHHNRRRGSNGASSGGGNGGGGHNNNNNNNNNLRHSSQSSLSYNHNNNPNDYNTYSNNSIASISSHNPILDERSNIRRSIMMMPGATSFAAHTNTMGGCQHNNNINMNNNNNNNNNTNRHHHQMRKRSYAVQSIHRGTQEWHGMLQPFVADLVFRSIASRRYQSDETGVLFRPYSCQAALLFCDLSGYSKITAAIAHKGAHVLSAAVNAYLSLLVRILREHGGDVVKFAGDAILAVWEGDEQELEINVLCAARCAVALQEQAGEHVVDHAKNLAFHIHCAVACGPLDSEIFEATQNSHMQKLYHFVGGDGVEEVGELVDLAASGEIAISNNCFNFLEQEGSYEPIPSSKNGAKLLRSLSLQDNELLELMDWHTNKLIDERLEMRDREIEESFIHRSVLAHLNHGGLSPTQIAQMRNLCVLFIAMVSTNNSPVVDWLMEVQTILDRSRCPIVQIIHDDKGVHIVAAINLYEAVPEASILGLNVCAELVHQRLGAAVGMAQGSTFCGVTGSTDACRWDITGPAVVRAARLMQYAIQHGHPCIIDESLYEEDPMAATRLRLVDPNVRLKGNPSPICVFTISANDVTSFAAFWILNNEHGGIHDTKIQEIQNHISCRTRSAVLVTGIPLAGMVIACQRAAGYSDLVPYLHVSQVSAGFLQLARTIATWFLYCGSGAKQYPDIVQLAEAVLEDMKANRWSCAHDQCVRLVNLAVEKHELKACFVVDRTQDLDRFSLSLIRAILRRPRTTTTTTNATTTTSNESVRLAMHQHRDDCGDDFDDSRAIAMSIVSMDLLDHNECLGQVCFLCTHVALYGAKSASDLAEEITRSHTSFKIPIIELGEASKEELRTMYRDLEDTEVGDRWLDAFAEASGFAAEYFLARTKAIRNMSVELWREGKPALIETSEDLVLNIPPGLIRKNKDIKVTEIRAEIAMRFSQIYDDIPPLCQLVMKIVTMATRRGFFKLPVGVLSDALNDLIDQGVSDQVMDVIMEALVDICVLKVEEKDERTVGFGLSHESTKTDVISMQSPALADIVMDVCTPVQIQSIATVLIDRLEPIMSNNFQVSLVIASLHCLLNQEKEFVKQLWVLAYKDFKRKSVDWSNHSINKWREIIEDEIRLADLEAVDILGEDFMVNTGQQLQRISPCMPMLKTYVAPVALGPMGLNLSLICRNTYHEHGTFFGASTNSKNQQLRSATSVACGQYMMQMTVVENYLRTFGIGAPHEEIDSEMEMFSFVANAAERKGDVETKAVLLVEEIVPRFIEHRLLRLHKLVAKLRKDRMAADDLFHDGDPVLARAYRAMQSEQRSRNDAAHDALMILATSNWKAQYTPEMLPLRYQQTIPNIRDATLIRLTDVEVIMLRHRQNIDDLEAFFITTALLHKAAKDGLF